MLLKFSLGLFVALLEQLVCSSKFPLFAPKLEPAVSDSLLELSYVLVNTMQLWIVNVHFDDLGNLGRIVLDIHEARFEVVYSHFASLLHLLHFQFALVYRESLRLHIELG